jgi:hypothetical protein
VKVNGMNWREDKAILTLGFFTVFFAVIALLIVWFRPTDGQTYQTFVSLLSGFVGALLLHLNPQKVAPAGSTTVTDTHVASSVPPAPVVPPVK